MHPKRVPPLKQHKFAPSLEEDHEFFSKISRNYAQVEGYLDFSKVAFFLSTPLRNLQQQIRYKQPIKMLTDGTASTHTYISWSLLNNPFPVYWVRTSLLQELIACEPSERDLSVPMKIKTGVILFPDNLIKAPGRRYLRWLAFFGSTPRKSNFHSDGKEIDLHSPHN